jgi:hypothetical protein
MRAMTYSAKSCPAICMVTLPIIDTAVDYFAPSRRPRGDLGVIRRARVHSSVLCGKVLLLAKKSESGASHSGCAALEAFVKGQHTNAGNGLVMGNEATQSHITSRSPPARAEPAPGWERRK